MVNGIEREIGMTPRIDVFDGTGGSEKYEILLDAIRHLETYKPGTKFSSHPDSPKFIEELKSRSKRVGDGYDLVSLINTAFKHKYFRMPTQKIILIDEPGYQGDNSMRGMTGGFDFDSNGVLKGAIAISTSGLSDDFLYSVSCHELGHIYGATHRDEGITSNGGRHCVDRLCAMNELSLNEETPTRRVNKLPMYCGVCQDGIRNFGGENENE